MSELAAPRELTPQEIADLVETIPSQVPATIRVILCARLSQTLSEIKISPAIIPRLKLRLQQEFSWVEVTISSLELNTFASKGVSTIT